jgi:hypothetical protein
LSIVSRTEIHQHETSGAISHHILRLHITMQEACGMYRLEGIRQDGANLSDFGGLESATSPHFLLQRFTLDQLHPQASPAINAIGAINSHHVRVPHAADEMALSD